MNLKTFIKTLNIKNLSIQFRTKDNIVKFLNTAKLPRSLGKQTRFKVFELSNETLLSVDLRDVRDEKMLSHYC